MAFPTSQITTSNLDASTDDPSQARADLLDAVQKLNTIIDEAGAAQGVALLNVSGQIPSAQIPVTLAPSSGVLTLAPVDGVVKIQDVLRLQLLDTDEVEALTSNAAGDVVYCSDGDGGSPCLAVYTGTDWLRVALGTAISAT